jgi:hypothetical protein
MLAVIIIIGAALLIATYFGLCAFLLELEELERRSHNIADVMHEADELSNKEDEQ